jgi:hypothetical protein
MNLRLAKTVVALMGDFSHDVVEAQNIAIALEGLDTFFGQSTVIFTRCHVPDLTAAADWLRAHGYTDRDPVLQAS